MERKSPDQSSNEASEEPPSDVIHILWVPIQPILTSGHHMDVLSNATHSLSSPARSFLLQIKESYHRPFCISSQHSNTTSLLEYKCVFFKRSPLYYTTCLHTTPVMSLLCTALNQTALWLDRGRNYASIITCTFLLCPSSYITLSWFIQILCMHDVMPTWKYTCSHSSVLLLYEYTFVSEKELHSK